MSLKMDFAGCGALNWDIFFEVEDLNTFQFENIKISPGREIVLERKQFLKLLNFLEKKGDFLFECGGGSAANTIYALSCWGFKAIFLGAVGEDSFGEKILKEMENLGINSQFIVQRGNTSLALILLDKKKDRFIAVSPGDSEKFLEASNVSFSLNEIWHFSSFASKEGQIFQKKILETYNLRISFDPGEVYTSLGKNFLNPWLKSTKYLFITEYELKELGLSWEDLWKMGIKKVFLKKGEKGAEFLSQERRIELPVYKVDKIVDNTGAGDYFNAGVLAGLKLGLSDEIALKLGLYSAAMSLRNYGRSGCLTKEEFQNYLNLLK